MKQCTCTHVHTLTVHVHSQSEGVRPHNIARCNLVLPTVITSDVCNSQTCSGDSEPCLTDRFTTPGQSDVWRWVGTELKGESKPFTFSRCCSGHGGAELWRGWRERNGEDV